MTSALFVFAGEDAPLAPCLQGALGRTSYAAEAWGPTAEITLVAVDEGGVSTPQVPSVAAPEQPAEPFLGLWWFPDFALPLDGLGTNVHAEVLIASKRPVEVVGSAVSWWGTLGHARPTFPVTLVPLDLSAWQDQTIRDVELFVRDTWGAHAETPWLSSVQVVGPSACGFAPAEVVRDPYFYAGLLHPVRVAVPCRGPSCRRACISRGAGWRVRTCRRTGPAFSFQ